jgi:26S proteasome regulatory subunit N7
MSLAITTSLINLPRAQLKDQVVKNPQVISVIREFPHFERLLLSLYNCDYSSFFRSVCPNSYLQHLAYPHVYSSV